MTRRNAAILLVLVALSLLAPVVVGVAVSFLKQSPKVPSLSMHSAVDLMLNRHGQ